MGSAQASDYLENKFIDHQFRAATWAKPTANWIALFTAAPSDAGGGTEVAGGGYARVNLPPSDSNWRAPQGGNGTTSNAVAIAYPAPTAAWGTVTHYGIFDAPTGGNLIIWDVLASPRTIQSGEAAPAFGPDTLAITIA